MLTLLLRRGGGSSTENQELSDSALGSTQAVCRVSTAKAVTGLEVTAPGLF